MAAFAGKLNVTIGANTTELEKKLKAVTKRIKALGKDLTNFGKNFSVMTAPIIAVGTAALGVGVKVERAFRTIKIGTGATGAALKGLQDDFKAIAVLGPQSFDDSAKAITDLNTMTGATGETLQKLSLAVLDASRMMGTDLGGTITSLGKLLNNWNMRADQGVAVLDKLFVASQAAGTSMDAIAQGVTISGGALRALGLGLDESIALISTLDKAGLNAQQAMKSFSKALVALAKEGVADTSEGLITIIEQIKSAKTMGDALDIGKNMFGIKAGADLTIAIREGKIELAELIAALRDAGGTIAATSKETMTLGERWSMVGNQAAMALEPLGTRLVKLAEEHIPSLLQAASSFSLSLDDWTIKLMAAAAAFGTLSIALGAMVNGIGSVVGAVNTLTASMLGPMGLVLAVGAATLGYIENRQEAKELREESERLAGVIDDMTNSFRNMTTDELRSQLDSLKSKLSDVEKQAINTQAEVAKAVSAQYSFLLGADMDQVTNVLAKNQDRDLAREKRELETKIKVFETEIQRREGAAVKKALSTGAPKTLKGAGGGKAAKKGGGGKSGPSALDLFVQEVQDRMKYFNEDGNAYMAKIDAMQAKTKPLSDDWKKLQDLRINIDDGVFSNKLQKIQDEIKYLDKDGAAFVPELQKMLEGLDPLSEKWRRVQDVITNITDSGYSEKWSNLAWDFSEGLLSATEYAKLLEIEIAGLTQGTDKWRARFSELQNIKASEVSKVLDSISRQFENGVISNAEYEAALAGIISEFKEFPRAAKIAAEALDAFQKQNELTTVSLERRLSVELKNVTKEFHELGGDAVMGVVDGFLDAAVRGGDFGESLRKLGEDIVYTTLKMAILQQMSGWLGQAFNGITGGGGLLGGMFGFSDGGAFSHGHIIPFAKGGVVHRPTIFPMASGAGLMGEAGPEAVMPLERDSHGRLGVVASGAMEAPSVTVNVINESSQPVTATQTGPSFDEQMRQMVVGVILRDQAQNGPITQNFRRR